MGSSFISDGLVVDMVKIVYAMRMEDNVSCGMAIGGILMNSYCEEKDLRMVLGSICEDFPEFFEREKLPVPQFSYKCDSLDNDLKLIGVFMKKT